MSGINGKLDRRQFLTAIAVAALLSLGDDTLSQQGPRSVRSDDLLLYVGTYTSGSSTSQGIYSYRFNKKSGELSADLVADGVADPSFLVIDRNRKYLYAVNETLEYEGKKSGSVSAFAINRKTGELKFLNKQPSFGGAPCHLTLSSNGRFLFTANYVGGNVAVFRVEGDGRLGESVDIKQHEGTGPIAERQESAHAHSINLDRNDGFAIACDLGADKLFIYKFDRKNGKLAPNPDQPYFKTASGAGPRHFAFHPSGKTAFVINELNSTVSVLSYDEIRGTLKETQTLSTLPEDWSGANTCADIHVSPNGRFVYGSNRGYDGIVCFEFTQSSGRLRTVQHISTQGKTPRNFTLDPTGNFLLAANQRSNSIVVFEIDKATGKLRSMGTGIKAPSPVCLRFA